MNVVARAKNILVQPNSEWPVIAAEPQDIPAIYTGYVLPLAAIPAVAGFIGSSIVEIGVPFLGSVRVPFVTGLSMAIMTFVISLIVVIALGAIISALAPTFGGEKNLVQGVKVAAYSYTPGWIAGALQILPLLGVLVLLISLYGLYLLYTGLPVVMKSASDRAVPYTAIVVICAIVMGAIITALSAAVGGMGAISQVSVPVPSEPVANAVTKEIQNRANEAVESVKKSSPEALDRLQQWGKDIEAASKQVEQAEKSGDTKGAVEGFGKVLGALLGGGTQVEPVDHRQLRALLPAQLAGLPRKETSSQKQGMIGINVANAKASYKDDQGRRIDLTMTDLGGAKGIAILANWATNEEDSEGDWGYKRTGKTGQGILHEEYNNNTRRGEYSLLQGERFLVELKADNIDMETLKQALSQIDFAKLASLKSATAAAPAAPQTAPQR